MESQKVLKFLAEVANLAATHFGESTPPASPSEANATPPPAGNGETVDAPPRPSCSLCGSDERRLHDFTHGRACSTCLASVAPDALRAECDRLMAAWATENGALGAALAAERATTERLRRELADVQQALQDATSTRGEDIVAELPIDFVQMATGAVVPFRLDDSRAFDVKVPAGVVDGARLRLRGQGGPGNPPGDILLTVRVAEHPYLKRDGDDIFMHVIVPLEAIRRGAMEVQAPTGPVSLSLAAENLGQTIRLRGRGIAPPGGQAGDLVISLDVSAAFSNRREFMWERFANAKEAFAALRSLSPETREHLMSLTQQSRFSTMHVAIREVIWALAVAHERGWREPRTGLSSDITAHLEAEELLPPAHPRSMRSRALSWLHNKTPLITKQPIPGVSLASWTVHFELMSGASWVREQSERLPH
jgi:hypothetical protein